ncbi:hypothetical protein DV515_00003892 [Chloebia gouldiae]|uniref:Uncharacterized protein n=1 Tax=Chloebia gouldiae TaxID=44316 RepID=A0A3L8SSP1_CHLGU|nr:hypothetical protein DV515_00003892 [Chloebia gouldiae]
MAARERVNGLLESALPHTTGERRGWLGDNEAPAQLGNARAFPVLESSPLRGIPVVIHRLQAVSGTCPGSQARCAALQDRELFAKSQLDRERNRLRCSGHRWLHQPLRGLDVPRKDVRLAVTVPSDPSQVAHPGWCRRGLGANR